MVGIETQGMNCGLNNSPNLIMLKLRSWLVSLLLPNWFGIFHWTVLWNPRGGDTLVQHTPRTPHPLTSKRVCLPPHNPVQWWLC